MKRVIEISTRNVRVFLRNSQIVLGTKDEELATIPAEDIGVMILDSTGISISSGAIKALMEHGAVILTCDDTHHPVGLVWPLRGNSLHGERIRIQVDASVPFKKNVWARLIQSKINNQAHNLPPGPWKERLVRLAMSVKSGDSGHCESQASRIYWSQVFTDLPGIGQPFRRHREGPPPNGLLNYGYAVIRAATARAICGAGLHPGLGIHHRNRYNQFCLADDLMEPYRPFIDAVVRNVIQAGETDVTKSAKGMILAALAKQVRVNGRVVSIDHAIEKTAQSLARSLEKHVKEGIPVPRAVRRLDLPEPYLRKES